MGRKKIVRTAEEQEAFLAERRLKNAEYQRRRRQAARDSVMEQRRNPVIPEDYLGEMNTLCMHCNARHFVDEKIANKGLSFSDCCSHGAVKLEPAPELPSELLKLFDGTHSKSQNFFEHIRNYNNSLSFASFNANLVNFQSRRQGPYCFKIQGAIYYQINTALYAADNENPSFGQLFFIDQNEAIDYRMQNNSHADQELCLILDTIIRENNAFAKSYEMMKIELRNQMSIHNQVEPELNLLFTLKPGEDRRRYNFQQTNEVAAVFTTTADGEIPESYVTIRNKNTRELQYVTTMDPNVEPWIYPLFYPYGTRGWHRDIPRLDDEEKRVTRNAYTKYMMAIRPNDFNHILCGRRLFQQWVVDSYVKIEKDRIQYCKDNQKELRADTYQGLNDYMRNYADDNNLRVGKTIILPSSFIGSPRNMAQKYQDSMALVNEKGRPDIFLTMTCNPNWKEIKENLLPHQQASDRPDIVARVFHLKKNRLIDEVVKNKCFGEFAAYVYVIEFQKRGLPHIHLLITLKQGFKINTPDTVDQYISAEIPDQSCNPLLYEIVTKNMIHGPCGDWCMKDGKCTKKFPKEFIDETKMDEHGYPNYRRRDKSYTLPNGAKVDNRWVVPHCPKLIQMFNCHMNVEIVTSIRSVKYLYKYVYKGHDAANVTIEDHPDQKIVNHDEITNFIDSRYVGPVESCYRILSKPLDSKSHSITRLAVHLPNQQCAIITDENFVDLNQASSTLIDYFKLNSEDPNARQYFYKDIPTVYVHKKKKVNEVKTTYWATRQKNFNVFGRMYTVSPTQSELFHLRLLLLHVKGATSFESLRTVDDILQPSFTAACLAMGLIEDDEEWCRAMEEATLWMMPCRLRLLFVRILIHCQPVHPEELWDKFKDAMSEDFALTNDIEMSKQIAYAHINELLINEGYSISNFPSMEQRIEIEYAGINNNISLAEMAESGQNQYTQLSEEQKKIVDTIIDSTQSNYDGNNCFYINGPGGSGKTFIYTTIYKLLTSKGIGVCSMAFTGIAALLLPNGKTVHKTFGLPVPLFSDSSSNIKAQSKQGIYLKETQVFIWDEAPMAPRWRL
uniref:ATP-dependent DNA helicase n=1 Tax=Trichogramma kaykai TaxID=54128 RepID=A0ABD2WRG2_9HYME